MSNLENLEAAVFAANRALVDARDAYIEAVVKAAGTDDPATLYRIVRRSTARAVVGSAEIRCWLEQRQAAERRAKRQAK